jgi:hypothetical protein
MDMPSRGDEIVRKRVRNDEWVVRFSSLAVIDRVWEFIAYKSNEGPGREGNLFWCRESGFVAASRPDVPDSILKRVEGWIRCTIDERIAEPAAKRRRHEPQDGIARTG